MKSLFRVVAMLLLAVTATSCDLSVLTEVEPPYYEKKDFENNVRNSVRRAIQTPGLDNGTTVVVTSAGDTLIAPIDSVMRATPNRTVYVEIQSPNYPKGISGKAVELISAIGVAGFICGLVLIIILFVFIIVIRRQNGRNSIIAKAIESNYPLPESFFTGHPKSAAINVTQLFTPSHSHIDPNNATPDTDGSFPSGQASQQTPPPFGDLSRSLKFAMGSTPTTRQFTTAIILLGLGLVVFISFAVSHNEGVGFFFGGTLFVFGLAKIITYFMGRKN